MSLYEDVSNGSMNPVADSIRCVNANSPHSPTAEISLHVAVKQANFMLVKLLIDKGANVNSVNVDMMTPLHYAACLGNVEIFNLLCHRGAMNALDRNYWTCLHHASFHGHTAIVDIILKINLSLINMTNSLGHTALHLACRMGHLEIIIKLLQHGASFVQLDKSSMTPFSYLPEIKGSKEFCAVKNFNYFSLQILGHEMTNLFKNPVYADIQFSVENSGSEENPAFEVLTGHRCVIHARCPMLLEESTPDREYESPNQIKIKNFSISLFRAIFEYIYSGSITFKNGEIDLYFALNLVSKGQELKMSSLSNYSEMLILSNLGDDPETILSVLMAVEDTGGNAPKISNYCRYYIMKNADKFASIPFPFKFVSTQLVFLLSNVALETPSSPFPSSLLAVDKAVDLPPNLNEQLCAPSIMSQTGAGGGNAQPSSSHVALKMEPQQMISSVNSQSIPSGPKGKSKSFNTSSIIRNNSLNASSNNNATSSSQYDYDNYHEKSSNNNNSNSNNNNNYNYALPNQASSVINRIYNPSELIQGALCECVKKIHMDLMCNIDAEPFLLPVDYLALNMPEYPDIVGRPMDLGTVKSNLENSYYTSLREWARDVRQVWDNARIFNSAESEVYQSAERMSQIFEQAYANLQRSIPELGPDYDVYTQRSQNYYYETYLNNLNEYKMKHGQQAANDDMISMNAMIDQSPAQYSNVGGSNHYKSIAGGAGMKKNYIKPSSANAKIGANCVKKRYRSTPVMQQMQQHANPHMLQLQRMNAMNVDSRSQNYAPLTQEELNELQKMIEMLEPEETRNVLKFLNLEPSPDGNEYEVRLDQYPIELVRQLQNYLYQVSGYQGDKLLDSTEDHRNIKQEKKFY